ncbi:MAG TPA: helix-turn-helix domain-containing protein [Thermodesulfobacteriota bacterium]
MARDASGTRRRILEAADELFYGEGIQSVGVDAIAERAGVTKRTLYYHFRSKDALIAAYIEARDGPSFERFRQWVDESEGPIAQRIAGMFTKLAARARDPRWKGCGFARAAAELAGLPGHPALRFAARHKKRFEAWLAGLLRRSGVANADALARQLLVLLDGAMTHMLIHRDPSYAHAAGKAAVALLEANRR